jgi:hypothetical protein
MQRIKLDEGHLSFDGTVVTLEFSGLLVQAVKKKASPRHIPIHDIVAVEVDDGGMMRPGYVRFRRASVREPDRFRAGTDPDTITFLSTKKPAELEPLVDDIRRRLANAPAPPPPTRATERPTRTAATGGCSRSAATPCGTTLLHPRRLLPRRRHGPRRPTRRRSRHNRFGLLPPLNRLMLGQAVEGCSRPSGGRRPMLRLARLTDILTRAGGAEAPQLAREVDRLPW